RGESGPGWSPDRDHVGGRMDTDFSRPTSLLARRRSSDRARASERSDDPVIAASWQRCRTVVDPGQAAVPVDDPGEVRDRWEASPIRRAGVGVEDQLADAAATADLTAAIADAEGRILWSASGPG